jgi:hypothetical protein
MVIRVADLSKTLLMRKLTRRPPPHHQSITTHTHTHTHTHARAHAHTHHTRLQIRNGARSRRHRHAHSLSRAVGLRVSLRYIRLIDIADHSRVGDPQHTLFPEGRVGEYLCMVAPLLCHGSCVLNPKFCHWFCADSLLFPIIIFLRVGSFLCLCFFLVAPFCRNFESVRAPHEWLLSLWASLINHMNGFSACGPR